MTVKSIPNFMGIDKFFTKYNLGHCHAAKQRIAEKGSGWNRSDGGQIVEIVT